MQDTSSNPSVSHRCCAPWWCCRANAVAASSDQVAEKRDKASTSPSVRLSVSGGSSHRLESRKLEPFLDFGGRARESSLLSKALAYLGLVFYLIRDFPIDFGNKTPEKNQKKHNLYTKKTKIYMFFELLLSNEYFYIFLGSDSIHGSSDSFFFWPKGSDSLES
jgi:hypothetical protein